MVKNSLRVRITLGLLFLLLVVIFIGGLAVFYLTNLARLSDNAIKENHQSLYYLRELNDALQEIPAVQVRYLSDSSINVEKYLIYKREVLRYSDSLVRNSTEEGEKAQATLLQTELIDYFRVFDKIREDIDYPLPNPKAYFSEIRPHYVTVRDQLIELRQINQDAVFKKNDFIQSETEEALLYTVLAGGFCLLVTIAFVLYFPAYITTPLTRFKEAIDEMGNKNYNHRMESFATPEFNRLADSFNKMATRIVEFENVNLGKMLVEKQRTETIIQHLQDGIIGINGRNRIIFINQVAEILLDLPKETAIGAYVPNVMVNNDVVYHVMVDLMDSSPGELFAEKTVKIPSSDRDLFFSRQVVSLPQGKTEGLIILLKNVTKFTEMDAAKTHFVATISHELKTPLSAIKMSIGLLKDKRMGELNEDQTELVADIEQATERLFGLSGEILQLSEMEAGKITLNLSPVNIDELINYAFQAIKVQKDQKSLILEADVSPDLALLEADSDKLKWVLTNYITNAVRYAPAQSKVSVQIYNEDNGVVFSVCDSGVGIPAIYHQKVFEKYFQVPRKDNDIDKKGSGLGLAICREFVESHKGEAWVDSKEGEGATFYFWLPLSPEKV